MTRVLTNKAGLYLGCAGLALAGSLVLAPQRAAAQAFQATPNVVQGGATIDRGTPNVDTITVDTMDTVIDWTPDEISGTALTFLPLGNTAIFQNNISNSDFGVLNRILPSTNGDVVVMNGAVISQIQSISGPTVTGGNVAFYSPTGILIGSTATFDVGRLVLTTLSPDISQLNAFWNGGSPLLFTGVTGDISQVQINAGATITSSEEGGYFAVVSPGIIMSGTANINGSTVYAAGEQVQLTYNAGLFDITIPVGSSVATSIFHDGTTGGPSSTGAGDNHVIYGVARAAANPMTMFFSGNLGFQPAAVAGVNNGDIILAANYDVLGLTVDGGNVLAGINAIFDADSATSTTATDLLVDSITATSDLLAIGSDFTQVNSSTTDSSFSGDLLIVGRNQAILNANVGTTTSVAGGVLITANDYGATGSGSLGNDPDAAAGSAFMDPVGGTISVGGNVIITADAVAGTDTDTSSYGSATGGAAQIFATGGTIDIAGTSILTATASQRGGATNDGGLMQGGFTRIGVQNGGSVTLQNNATMSSNAFGGSPLVGQDAIGGTAHVSVLTGGGTLSILGTLQMSANGQAGSSTGADPGGFGTGGTAQIFNQDPGSAITVTGDVGMLALGQGGSNTVGDGGSGTGGTIEVFAVQGGTIDLGGNLTMLADGLGGDSTGTGIGADGTGGLARISTLTGGGIDITGNAITRAFGGGGTGTSGGNGTGGIAVAVAVAGSISIGGGFFGISQATGGNANVGFGGTGGTGQGGTAALQADGDDTNSASVTVAGGVQLNVSGFGGSGGAGDGGSTAPGNGGDGLAGVFSGTLNSGGAFLLAGRDNGTLDVGNVTIFANGQGGLGGTGGSGQAGGNGGIGVGGTAQAGTWAATGSGAVGNGSATMGDVILGAVGTGGDGGIGAAGAGIGGIGNGGTAVLTASLNSDVAAGNLDISANGFGGDGSTGGGGYAGGSTTNPNGGAGITAVAGTNVSFGILNTTANGFGGVGTNGPGGNSEGGEAVVSYNGQLNGTSITLDAQGNGGSSTTGAAGAATGGFAHVDSIGGNATIAGAVNTNAQSFGGFSDSGNGGLSTGGLASINLTNAALNAGSLLASAGANGGPSTTGTAGDAIGGTASITAAGSSLAVTGDTVVNTVSIAGEAPDGTAGNAEGGESIVSAGGGSDFSLALLDINANAQALGPGGNAEGGTADLSVGHGTVTVSQLVQSVNAESNGGIATGGSISLFVEPDTGTSGTVDATQAFLEASASGGSSNTAGDFDLSVTTDGTAIFQTLSAVANGIGITDPSAFLADGGNILITGSLAVSTAGLIEFETANGGSIIGGTSPADLSASFNIESDGTISILGDDDNRPSFGALSMALVSNDINVPLGARFGAVDLFLVSTNQSAPAVIGGTTNGSGYTLTQDEAERIEASSVTFEAPALSSDPGRAPDIEIRDIVISGSEDDGPSLVQVLTPGIIGVTGFVNYTNAGSGDSLQLFAGEQIQIVTASPSTPVSDLDGFPVSGGGQIYMNNADGDISGFVGLFAPSIIAAEADTIGLILSNPSDPSIPSILADPGGRSTPTVTVAASSVSLIGESYIYFQNVGTASLPSAVAVGPVSSSGTGSPSFGGLFLAQSSDSIPGLMDAIVFGLQVNSDGSFTSGNDFFPLASFNMEPSNHFTSTATLNGCFIVSGTCGASSGPIDEAPPINNPAIIEDPVVGKPTEPGEEEGDSEFGADFPGLLEASLISEDGVVDDPVTTGGDSALYAADEDSEDEDEDEDDEEEDEDGE